MKIALVTFKFPIQAAHNPRFKVSGLCDGGGLCTDVTGQHHTVALEWVGTQAEMEAAIRETFGPERHITRIEFTLTLPLGDAA